MDERCEILKLQYREVIGKKCPYCHCGGKVVEYAHVSANSDLPCDVQRCNYDFIICTYPEGQDEPNIHTLNVLFLITCFGQLQPVHPHLFLYRHIGRWYLRSHVPGQQQDNSSSSLVVADQLKPLLVAFVTAGSLKMIMNWLNVIIHLEHWMVSHIFRTGYHFWLHSL